MSYLIEIEKEITIGETTYLAFVQAEVEYDGYDDPEPCGVEINNAEISPLEGDLLPLVYEGRGIEKVIVEGHPELTEAIDKVLWDKIQMHGEDNYQDLIRDLRDAYDERDL
jgi:hypothetical protein